MHAKVLRYFVEVVRAGSIRKAAEQLHVVPTAVNRQILNLEEELGTPLFERIHNKLRLTPVGEIVLAHARSTLREFEGVRARVDAVRGLRQGEASLATTTGLASALLPTVALRCRVAHPGLHLKLLDLPNAAVLRAVAEGDADLALAYDVPTTAGLRTLFTSEWLVGAVVPPGHALTARATTTLADCVGFPLILPAASLSLRAILDGAFGRAAICVSPVVESSSTALMRALVAQQQGITFLNRLDVQEELRAGRLVFVPLRDTSLPTQRLSLVTRAGAGPSAAAGLLAELVIDCLEQALVR
ncbi:LysR family transcriptional regulator [Pseudorhodoferax sp.]|uniref:LysR family transcriptional regulator n=1 Tax=Pseudorhodoferax sp. TaxID=1993553 RepID=UPI002DD62B70|nr:LysR family transcriptional regulator [Pseudorhodoferax sp.]